MARRFAARPAGLASGLALAVRPAGAAETPAVKSCSAAWRPCGRDLTRDRLADYKLGNWLVTLCRLDYLQLGADSSCP